MEVILFHLNQIGDFCFSLPIAAAVQQRYPEAEICSVVRPNLVPLAQRARPIDSLEVRPRSLTKAYWSLLVRLRARRADLAIVLSTSPGPCLLARLCGAKKVVAFDNDWARRLIGGTVPYDTPPSLPNNLRMAEHVAGELVKRDYAGLLHTTPEDRVTADQLLSAYGVPAERPIAVLAPFGSAQHLWKCWPPDRFARVATLLYERAGLTPVLIGGRDEAGAASEITAAVAVPGASLVGETDTGQLVGVLARAALFIGQDSGPTHLAATLGCPTLAIFGPTDPQLTGPVGENSHVMSKGLACSPCHEHAAQCSSRECLLSITPEEVADEAVALAEQVGACRR